MATVLLGTVATVQNLNKRVKRKKKKKTNETTVTATVLHSKIRWMHSTELGMAMGRSGAEGWDLRPHPA